MNYVIYKTIKFVGKPFFNLLYRPRYIGVNNIPNDVPVILAGNHTDNFDAAFMICAPKRINHMLAKKELFKSKVGNIFFRSMGCIPVDRSIHDENAKKEAINVLNNNGLLGIFPEGTVNRTDNVIIPFKYGAVSFAKKTNAYIVPFAITGKYKLFRKSIKITFGHAYKVNKDIEIENEILESKVTELILKGDDNYKKNNKRK